VSRGTERGFTLLESLAAGALASALVMAITASLLGTMHATARIADRAALTDHALNILSDLRESTAYDDSPFAGTELAKLAGRTVSATFGASASDNAPTLTATIVVSQPATPEAPVVATVTVSDAEGVSATETQTLFVEAPPPGSIVDGPTPTPSTGLQP
jgi:hypothetical protein